MRFPLVLWWRQWTQPSLFYRRRSALFRRASRWFYRVGKEWGDRLAVRSHRDFVRALAAEGAPKAAAAGSKKRRAA